MYDNNYAVNRRPHFSMGDAFKAFFKNYVKFDGRASRSEFWWVMLATFIISSVLASFGPAGDSSPHGAIEWIANILSSIWSLIILIPSITLTTRRLHDTDRSGWWQLLICVPIVGWIILIVFLTQDSKPEGVKRDGPVQPWMPVSNACNQQNTVNNSYNQPNMNNQYNNMPYPTENYNGSNYNGDNSMPYRNTDDGGVNLDK